MKGQRHQRVQPLWGASGGNARTLLAQLRQQVMRYADVPLAPTDVGPDAGKAAPPMSVDNLPTEMQQLVKRYEKAHQGTAVQPIRLLSVGGPDDVGAAFIDADIPSNDELVLLVLTETAVSVDHVEVRSQVLVARHQ